MLSDGSVHQLMDNGSDKEVLYEDRGEYIRLVQNVKMNEFKDQVTYQLLCSVIFIGWNQILTLFMFGSNF